jgi:hypothetical protein
MIFDRAPEGNIAELKARAVELAKQMIAEGKDPEEAFNVALSKTQLSDIDARSREEMQDRVFQVELPFTDEEPEEENE